MTSNERLKNISVFFKRLVEEKVCLKNPHFYWQKKNEKFHEQKLFSRIKKFQSKTDYSK